MALYALQQGRLEPLEPVAYPERDLEDWLERNPHVLAEGEPLLIIGRQVSTEAGPIDLLALNDVGDLVVVELKKGRTPREVIAQALDYLSVAERWAPETIEATAGEYLRRARSDVASVEDALSTMRVGEESETEEDAADGREEVRLNTQQHVYVVAQEVPPALRRVANMLNRRGLSIRCVEFRWHASAGGMALADVNVVVKPEDTGSDTGDGTTKWTLDTFRDRLQSYVEDDEHSWQLAQRLLEFAQEQESRHLGQMKLGRGKMGTCVLRCLDASGAPVSCFGLTVRGDLGIFYGALRGRLDAAAYESFIAALADLPTMADIREQIARRQRGFGMQTVALYSLPTAFRRPGELERFYEAIRQLQAATARATGS